MSKAVFSILAIILAINLIGCSDNAAGGSAGEVGNPKVAVFVKDDSGTPVESVVVSILFSNFNPLVDEKKSVLITDSSGYVFFECEQDGEFIISGKKIKGENAFISRPLQLNKGEIDTVSETLSETGTINILVDDSVDIAGCYYYIAGTNYSVQLSDIVTTDSGSFVSLNEVPEGFIPSIMYYDTINSLVEIKITDTLILSKSEDIIIDQTNSVEFFTNDIITNVFYGVKDLSIDTAGEFCIVCPGGILYGNEEQGWSIYNPLNNETYKGDSISSVLVDKYNVCWYGGNGGLLRHFYDSTNGYWQYWNQENGKLLNDTVIAMTTNLERNRVWIATKKGITCFNENDTIFIHDDSVHYDLSTITALANSLRDGIWIGTSQGVLINLMNNNALSQYALEGSGLDSCSILSMEEDLDTNLWIVTDKKVIKFNNGVWEIVDPSLYYNIDVIQIAVNRYDGSVWFRDNKTLCRYENSISAIVSNEDIEPPLMSIDFPGNDLSGSGYIGMTNGIARIK